MCDNLYGSYRKGIQSAKNNEGSMTGILKVCPKEAGVMSTLPVPTCTTD